MVSNNATKPEATQDLGFAGLLHFITTENWAFSPYFGTCRNSPDAQAGGISHPVL